MYNWRVDLTDNTYKYDRLVEPAGPTSGGTRGERVYKIRTEKNDDASDVAQSKGDTPSGVYDGGGERVPETPMETSDDESGVTRPKGDTPSGVYDGGGERVLKTLPNPNGPPDRSIRSYTIRVDKLKQINKGLKDKLLKL